jgi:hypothetical protein
MTNKTISNDDAVRVKSALKGLTDYQEIIELASEQLELGNHLRVSILLDEYRSMAEYFLDEIEAAILFSEFHDPENQPLDKSVAVAKCARIGVGSKPSHSSIPTDDQAEG